MIDSIRPKIGHDHPHPHAHDNSCIANGPDGGEGDGDDDGDNDDDNDNDDDDPLLMDDDNDDNRKNNILPVVAQMDIMACNGSVIHLVTEVMLPNFVEEFKINTTIQLKILQYVLV